MTPVMMIIIIIRVWTMTLYALNGPLLAGKTPLGTILQIPLDTLYIGILHGVSNSQKQILAKGANESFPRRSAVKQNQIGSSMRITADISRIYIIYTYIKNINISNAAIAQRLNYRSTYLETCSKQTTVPLAKGMVNELRGCW